jgi:hypothetical protein
MPVTLPPDALILPLTREMFGPAGQERPIDGRIEDITFGFERLIGRCLVMDGGDDVFSHPTLFEDASFAAPTGGWVRLSFDREKDRILMRPRHRGATQSGFHAAIDAPPAETAQIPLDAILEFMKCIEIQETCIRKDKCQGVRKRPLRLERSVCYVERESRHVVVACKRCFSEMTAKDPAAVRKVILDGSQLPPHAPVTIFAAPVR